MYVYILYIYRSETKWIQHSCTQSIYYCPLGWRKYNRTDRYMGDKGGGGLQLSASCALSTMISQCCTFRRSRCWIQFFCLECRWMQSVVCFYKMKAIAQNPHKLTNNESCVSQTCSAFTIFHCWYVLLSVFSWCFCNIGMWQAGNASGIYKQYMGSSEQYGPFMSLLSENHRKSKWRTTRSKPNCPRWNQSSLVF